MALPVELYESILLYLDMNTLIHFTMIKPICIHDFYFWIAKFKHDHVSILTTKLPHTQRGWIVEYNKVVQAREKAMKLMKQVNYYYIVYIPSNDEKYHYFYHVLNKFINHYDSSVIHRFTILFHEMTLSMLTQLHYYLTIDKQKIVIHEEARIIVK